MSEEIEFYINENGIACVPLKLYNDSLEEIERLNNKYNKALELLADYNLPCEYDEGKIPDNYCEENCSDDYKKCWNKYIELELKGDSSNE